MKKISCLIVDDEPNAAELILRYTGRVDFLECKKVCYNAFEALSYLKNNPTDLIFLDISMPGLSGLELAAQLTPGQKIIFTTAHSEHALSSFSFFVVDYLLKPITFNRFLQAVQKAKEIFTSNAESESYTDYFYIKTARQLEKIHYNDILYFEGMREYVRIFTRTKSKLVYKRMKELSQTLPEQFIRVHNSYIVNTQHILASTLADLLVADARIPISASYRKEVQTWLSKKAL